MNFPSGRASSDTVLNQCDLLAEISALPEGVLRAYLTPEHLRANKLVASWIEAAGMRSWQDAAGNICGRYEAVKVTDKVLLLGSHLDTIPNAGKYDGIVGVLAAIEVIRSFYDQDLRFPFHIDVVGFGDEEGVRFGATLLGSRAVAGTFSDDLWKRKDDRGVSLYEAFDKFGLEPARIGEASRANHNLIAYWELHIEQGPVLEHEDWPIGVVTAIAGARRFTIDISGMAGHAGTVPMHLRKDALVAAAKLVLEAERIAIKHGIVATVGQIDVRPGGVNIIPGTVKTSLDIRSDDDARRDTALAELQDAIAKNCTNVKIEWEETHSADAVQCDTTYQELFAKVIKDNGMKPLFLLSGAGHDAMAIAEICPVAMLFMRCKEGISHHPAEKIYPFDTQVSLNVLRDSIMTLAAQYD